MTWQGSDIGFQWNRVGVSNIPLLLDQHVCQAFCHTKCLDSSNLLCSSHFFEQHHREIHRTCLDVFLKLVGGLEHVLFFHSVGEFHHPNWLSLIFFRGVGRTTDQIHRLSIDYSHIYPYLTHITRNQWSMVLCGCGSSLGWHGSRWRDYAEWGARVPWFWSWWFHRKCLKGWIPNIYLVGEGKMTQWIQWWIW